MLLAAEAGSTEVAARPATRRRRCSRQAAVDHVVVNASATGAGADAVERLRLLVAAANASGARSTVLVSADGDITAADAMLVGATQIVVKPIGGADLVGALASLYGNEPEPFVAPAFRSREAA